MVEEIRETRKLSPREELRIAMVRNTIEELKSLVSECNPLALRSVYVLGRIKTTPREEEAIRSLISVYGVDCECSKKSREVDSIHRLIERYPKPPELKKSKK